METTRRDFASKTAVGITLLMAGCAGSGQSGSGSASQNGTDSDSQPSPTKEPNTPTDDSNSSSSTQTDSPTATDSADASTSTKTDLSETTDSTRATPSRRNETTQNTAKTSTSQETRLVGQGEDWSSKNGPQITASIGSQSQLGKQEKPHSILVWNDASTTRTIQIKLVPANNSAGSAFQESYQLKSGAYAALKLMRSKDYTVHISVGGGAMKRATRVSGDLVDCSSSTTYIAVRKDGSVDSNTASTMVACASEVESTTTTRNQG